MFWAKRGQRTGGFWQQLTRVQPSSLATVISAPFSTRNLATSRWPRDEAALTGIPPRDEEAQDAARPTARLDPSQLTPTLHMQTWTTVQLLNHLFHGQSEGSTRLPRRRDRHLLCSWPDRGKGAFEPCPIMLTWSVLSNQNIDGLVSLVRQRLTLHNA